MREQFVGDVTIPSPVEATRQRPPRRTRIWIGLLLAFGTAAFVACAAPEAPITQSTAPPAVPSTSPATPSTAPTTVPSTAPTTPTTASVAPPTARIEPTATTPAPTTVPATSTPAPAEPASPTPEPAPPTVAPASPTPVPPTPVPSPTSAPVVEQQSNQPAASAVSPATTQLWRQESSDFASATLDGTTVDGSALRLIQENGQYVSRGEIVSAEHAAAFPFDDVVLSWNASSPPGTSLRFDVRAKQANGWSSWYTLGVWKDGTGASVSGQADDRGQVEIDTLKLRAPATALQYRVELTTTNPQTTPTLELLTVVYADLSRPLTGPTIERPANAARELDVPTFSQLDQDPAVAGAVCSPTSLAMVLNYWGKQRSVPEVIQGVRDRVTGIWGNWPLNTAFAAANGLEAYVDRFYSMEQLEAEIAAGRPVITSIRFERGELDGAPLLSTSGHLLVVRGFTPEGDVIVNDPYGRGDGVRRVYRREQFANVWIGNGGIVYLVRPPDAA